MTAEFNAVLEFWFEEIDSKLWWTKDISFDDLIRQRFSSLLEQAIAGELAPWRESAQGSLAEVIVLDQLSRNIYRDDPRSFAQDPQALALAQIAIAKGYDTQLQDARRSFLYLPFMHSESALIHEQAVILYESLDSGDNLNFELRHKSIIDRFGRYPHRNAILGRESTPAEREFLSQPGSSF
ncbi:MAG: DUF924 family protein [Pseudomonadota bacterium]|nr:DUF924 family protein [Pseudomonadota bacterium]